MSSLDPPASYSRAERESRALRVIAVAVPLALAFYAIVAVVVMHRGISAAAAALAAVLLWRRHRRARFSAYIFLSAVAARGLFTHAWPVAGFAAAAIAVLQLPAARRAWPSVNRARGRA